MASDALCGDLRRFAVRYSHSGPAGRRVRVVLQFARESRVRRGAFAKYDLGLDDSRAPPGRIGSRHAGAIGDQGMADQYCFDADRRDGEGLGPFTSQPDEGVGPSCGPVRTVANAGAGDARRARADGHGESGCAGANGRSPRATRASRSCGRRDSAPTIAAPA